MSSSVHNATQHARGGQRGRGWGERGSGREEGGQEDNEITIGL